MSLPDVDHQRSFFDTDQVCSGLLDQASSRRFKLFGERVWPALLKNRPILEAMYCADNGRPAEEPARMLGVLILQFMERLPDRQAADACTYDLRWKHALNIPIDEKAFHPTSLVKFRNRLMDHGLETLGFDTVIDAMRESGYLRKRSKQRIDSTHIVGLVKNMSRLENVRETLRLALEELGGDEGLEKPADWVTWWERYVENSFDYRSTKPQLIKKMDVAGRDMREVLNWASTLELSATQLKRIELLHRVFDENFNEEAGVTTQHRAQPAGAVQNPHDPEAEWCTKSTICSKDKQWIGYKSHISESVDEKVSKKNEPTRAVLTSVSTVPATSSDKVGIKVVEGAIGDQEDIQPETIYADGGYTSAAEIQRFESESRNLRGPVQPAPRKKGRFSADDFDIDISTRSATCPAGKLNTQCSRLEEKNQKVSYRYEWSTQCSECSLRDACILKSMNHRTVTVGENHNILQARRREMKTDAYKKDMHSRNGIEATISELVRGHGLRRSRYRGLVKTAMQNLFIGAACNIKRWANRIQWEEMAMAAA